MAVMPGGRTALRARNARTIFQLPITYTDLWNPDKTNTEELIRKGYAGVTLTTITTWKGDAARHAKHIEEVGAYLTSGSPTLTVDGKVLPPTDPCAGGISTSYIDGVFSDSSDELKCGLSVWATVPGSTTPFMVLGLVCKDLEPLAGIDNRLFLWMVCGKYPKAFALAMRTLKQEAIQHEYSGLCLTASQLYLVPVYKRYGFSVTPNACGVRTRNGRKRLYRDRTKHFMCYEADVDCSASDAWADRLMEFGRNTPRPTYPARLRRKPLSKKEMAEKRSLSEEFYFAKGDAIAPEVKERFPTGDGIFMDMCFGA
jgi:hypothetical protein